MFLGVAFFERKNGKKREKGEKGENGRYEMARGWWWMVGKDYIWELERVLGVKILMFLN